MYNITGHAEYLVVAKVNSNSVIDLCILGGSVNPFILSETRPCHYSGYPMQIMTWSIFAVGQLQCNFGSNLEKSLHLKEKPVPHWQLWYGLLS